MNYYTFPKEFYNIARKQQVKIKTEERVVINNVEHLKLTSEENDTIYLMNGKLHKEGEEPACKLEKYGVYFKIWLKEGIIQREDDKPAIERTSGNDYLYCWYKDGKRHREGDKPAEVSPNSSIWYKEGNIHRETGKPAWIKNKNNSEDTYWIHGKKVNKEQAKNYARIGVIAEKF